MERQIAGWAPSLRRRRTEDAFHSKELPAVMLRSHLCNVARVSESPSRCTFPQRNKILPFILYMPAVESRSGPGGCGWQIKAAAGGG